MTYRKNFVAALKVGGKVLRESGDQVEFPFGSEYSILMKNLDSIRVQANVQIDGEDVSGWLVINPNGALELERFIRNGNFDRGNRFKFIERTEAVERGRGIKVEDGLIRIEFKREKVFEAPKVTEHHYNYWPLPYVQSVPVCPVELPYTWCETAIQNSSGANSGGVHFLNNVSLSNSSIRAMSVNVTRSATPNDAGITVGGSESTQKFYAAQDFATEQSEVITLKLVGRRGKSSVSRPVTVDLKPKCSTCKKVNKGGAKFCSTCGTSLEII